MQTRYKNIVRCNHEHTVVRSLPITKKKQRTYLRGLMRQNENIGMEINITIYATCRISQFNSFRRQHGKVMNEKANKLETKRIIDNRAR